MANVNFGNVALPYTAEDMLAEDADYRGVSKRKMAVQHSLHEIRKLFVEPMVAHHAPLPSYTTEFSPPLL